MVSFPAKKIVLLFDIMTNYQFRAVSKPCDAVTPLTRWQAFTAKIGGKPAEIRLEPCPDGLRRHETAVS
jgi:hypothetical protein